jgi:hypothetical protein
MSTGPAGAARVTRRRRGRRSPAVRVLAFAAAGVLVFVVGLAFGRATAEGPPEGTQTLVRTLSVLTVEPARDTVTVTVRE